MAALCSVVHRASGNCLPLGDSRNDLLPSAEINYLRRRGSKPQVLSCWLWDPSLLANKSTRLWGPLVEKWLLPSRCFQDIEPGQRSRAHTKLCNYLSNNLGGVLPELLNLTPDQGGKTDWAKRLSCRSSLSVLFCGTTIWSILFYRNLNGQETKCST